MKSTETKQILYRTSNIEYLGVIGKTTWAVFVQDYVGNPTVGQIENLSYV
jgi:hypothetical protein